MSVNVSARSDTRSSDFRALALLGWVRNPIGLYEPREIVGFDRFRHVQATMASRVQPCSGRLEVTSG